MQETPMYVIVIIHMELLKAPTNSSCGVIGDQLIGPYITPQRLTADIYFLQDKVQTILENVPLQTRRQISQVIRQYLNHNFPNRWIGHGGAQNWPPRSPDLNPWVMCPVCVLQPANRTQHPQLHTIPTT